MSSLPSGETGEVTSQTQTTVRVSFLAVLKTTLQGDHARHDVQVAEGGDLRRWLPLGYSERREVRGSHHGNPGQHGHQQGDGGGQLAEVVHPAETLLQAAVSPVTDWHFERYQLVCGYFLLLLLAKLFFVATVSK